MDEHGFLTRLGVVALAAAVFLAISFILSLIITFPLKLLCGCTPKQALHPEPQAIFFGITVLCIILAHLYSTATYPNEDRITATIGMAIAAGIKSIHSLFVIWSNPILGTVEVPGIVRH